ncbi:F-box/LRR-repeat protein 12-like isoform X2 [Halichondria panicea]|uniref:F-box/LRR-repeat protein 12-like isoform X2 n=1 Tax=Halichondria panicea TaxID=6063 RepID=UPI00312BB22F
MAARSKRARFQSDTRTDGPPRKKMKAAESIKQQLDILAPRPILDGLPDNIMLCILSLLDIWSLIKMSRVCKRFHHLYSDEFIWNSVDLTRESVGFKLDPRRLKNIIRLNLPKSVSRVKLSSNAFSLSSKQPVVTESVFDLLFERCPNITSIAVHQCDMTVLSPACKLYHAIKLTHLSFVECKSNHVWFKEINPSWPNLTHLSFEGTTMIGDSDLEYIASGLCGKSIRGYYFPTDILTWEDAIESAGVYC